MREWEYTLADGRVVAGGNSRHSAVAYWEPEKGRWTDVEFVRLNAEAYGADCPRDVCWCHADIWSVPTGTAAQLSAA